MLDFLDKGRQDGLVEELWTRLLEYGDCIAGGERGDVLQGGDWSDFRWWYISGYFLLTVDLGWIGALGVVHT